MTRIQTRGFWRVGDRKYYDEAMASLISEVNEFLAGFDNPSKVLDVGYSFQMMTTPNAIRGSYACHCIVTFLEG